MMLHVNIVISDRNWIMEEFANQILSGADKSDADIRVTVSLKEDIYADINYYLPYSIVPNKPVTKSVALFTHIEEDFPEAKKKFFDVAKKVDYCVCMAERYEKKLKDSGVEYISTVYPGISLDYMPKIKIGIVGRGYHTGRKNESMVAQLRELDFCDFVFTGTGWPGVSKYLVKDKMPAFYQDIDYLLVPSKIEGGPMPAIEAVASGTPVIAPDVGFMNDVDHISYKNSDVDDLIRVLKDIYLKRSASAEKVREYFAWDAFSKSHVDIFLSVQKRLGGAGGNLIHSAPKKRLSLVTHGAEDKAKGGPTTRVQYTAQATTSEKIDVVCEGLKSKADAYHVFNIWPPSAAIKTAEDVVSKTSLLVFSPIFLNLSLKPDWEHVRNVFVSDGDEVLLENIYSHYHEMYGHGFEGLWETVPEHFEGVKYCCSLASKVIALSNYESLLLQTLGVDKEKIAVIKNCPDPKVLSFDGKRSFSKTYGIKNYLLVVGRVEARKNQLFAAIAAKKQGKKLVILGSIGDPQYAESLRERFPETVVFIDRIEDRDLLFSCYYESDLYIQCSWSEGASLATLEAYACGAKVALMPLSGEDEYYKKEEKGVFFIDLFSLSSLGEVICTSERLELTGKNLAEMRRVRVQSLIQNYTEGHAKVYNSCFEERQNESGNDDIYVDITSYAHGMYNKVSTTGALALEKNLVQAFAEHYKQARFVYWDHRSNSFILMAENPSEVKFADFLPASTTLIARSRRSYVSRSAENVSPSIEGTAVKEANVDISVLGREITQAHWIADHGTLTNGGGVWAIGQVVKMFIRSMPGSLEKYFSGIIRKFRPNFTLRHTFPTLDVLSHLKSLPVKVRENKLPQKKSLFLSLCLRSSYGRSLYLQKKSRLIVIGNAWMSNDRYLDRLRKLQACNQMNVSTIIYDLLPIQLPEFFPDGYGAKFDERLHKYLSFSEKVFGISASTAADLKSYVGSKRLQTQVDSIPMGTFGKKIAASSKSHKLTSSEFILYVSSVNKRKNHKFLCSVWSYIQAHNPGLKNVKLVFVGKNIFSEDQSLNTDGVEWMQNVSDAELSLLYQSCLFSVYPSIAEGYGIPVQESLCYGKVCIASNLPSLSEVNHPALIKVPVNDFFAWVDIVKKMLQDDEVRLTLESTTKGFESELPSWKSIANKLMSK